MRKTFPRVKLSARSGVLITRGSAGPDIISPLPFGLAHLDYYLRPGPGFQGPAFYYLRSFLGAVSTFSRANNAIELSSSTGLRINFVVRRVISLNSRVNPDS